MIQLSRRCQTFSGRPAKTRLEAKFFRLAESLRALRAKTGVAPKLSEPVGLSPPLWQKAGIGRNFCGPPEFLAAGSKNRALAETFVARETFSALDTKTAIHSELFGWAKLSPSAGQKLGFGRNFPVRRNLSAGEVKNHDHTETFTPTETFPVLAPKTTITPKLCRPAKVFQRVTQNRRLPRNFLADRNFPAGDTKNHDPRERNSAGWGFSSGIAKTTIEAGLSWAPRVSAAEVTKCA